MGAIPANKKLLINILAGITLVALIVGLVTPLLTLKKLVFVTNTFSIWSGLATLWQQGHIPLSLLLFVFSVLFPLIKIFIIWFCANMGPDQPLRSLRWIKWLGAVGKWSMLDVFVVAVLVASVKLGALASIEIHYGLYAFAIAVLLTKILIWMLGKFLMPKTGVV